MYVKISGPNTEIYNTFTPRDLNDIGVYTFLPAPQRTFQSGLLLQPGKVVHREETRRLVCLGAEPRVLPAMTRHHRRSRTVRRVPYHHRFAPAAVTQGGSHVELCTSPLRSHGRANMGGCDGPVVVRRDFTAAAGQTQPVPSPTMCAGDVCWATQGLSLGYDAHRPPQCHNQPHLPDHRPFEPTPLPRKCARLRDWGQSPTPAACSVD